MDRERILKIVLVIVGLLFVAAISANDAYSPGTCIGHDDEPLLHARNFPAAGLAESVSTSQPDRVHWLVEFGAWHGYGRTGIASLD